MSSTQLRAFKPFGPTVSLAVTASSQFIDLTASTPGTCSIRVANVGTQEVFIELVELAATAASLTTSLGVLPNTVEVFTFANDKVGVAVIAASTGSTIRVTPGEGL